jgi:hypothetical protein
MTFGRYRIAFKPGVEPVYLEIAWPSAAPSDLIARRRADARYNAGLMDMHWLGSERSEYAGNTYECQLYAEPDGYFIEPICRTT